MHKFYLRWVAVAGFISATTAHALTIIPPQPPAAQSPYAPQPTTQQTRAAMPPELITLEGAALRAVPRGWSVIFAPNVDWQQPATLDTDAAQLWTQKINVLANARGLAVLIDEIDKSVTFRSAYNSTPALSKLSIGPKVTPPPVAPLASVTLAVPPNAVTEATQARTPVAPAAVSAAVPPDQTERSMPTALAPTASITASVASPLPLPTPPLSGIELNEGEALSKGLRKWLASNQYLLVWNLPTDLIVSLPYTRNSASMTELLLLVMQDFRLQGTLFPVNRVFVVRDPALKD